MASSFVYKTHQTNVARVFLPGEEKLNGQESGGLGTKDPFQFPDCPLRRLRGRRCRLCFEEDWFMAGEPDDDMRGWRVGASSVWPFLREMGVWQCVLPVVFREAMHVHVWSIGLWKVWEKGFGVPELEVAAPPVQPPKVTHPSLHRSGYVGMARSFPA